jgi:transcriptional regulator with XRE-family HTH domain
MAISHRSFGARLGSRVRARREARGYTQAQLAEKIGVSSNYFGVLERGLKLPTLDRLIVLAKALDVSPAELLGDVRPRDPWIEEVLALATSIPEHRRALAIALLRVLTMST